MKLKDLVKFAQKEIRKGNGDLEVRMFDHDHDPTRRGEGGGSVEDLRVVTNDAGETFIALTP